jgi:mono/diheme cytochrome c family protein
MKQRRPGPRRGSSSQPPHSSRSKSLVFVATLGVALVFAGLLIWRGSGISRSTESFPPAARTQRYVERGHGQLTFHRDIAPLIHRHCAGCHRPEESAPFALLTYKDVKERSAEIVAVTARRSMPPWLPAGGGPAFVGEHERRLTGMKLG